MGTATQDGKGWLSSNGRLVATIQDGSILTLGLVTVAGLALVAAGWAIQGRSFVPGLLMQLGTSMMLLVPLALLGFILENRMRRAEEQIRATAAQLETLTTVTRQRLFEHQRQREELLNAAQREPSQGAIRVLLREAVEIGAVVPSGIRVALSADALRLRFQPDGTDVVIRLEEPDGTVLGSRHWRTNESANDLAQSLAEALRALDQYPGDKSFDPSTVLQQLLKVVRLGIEARSGERGSDLGPLIEVPNEQWAISSDGLFSLQRPYHIPVQRIIGSHENWPRYMRSQSWVNISEFEEAYRLARHLLQPYGKAKEQV